MKNRNKRDMILNCLFGEKIRFLRFLKVANTRQDVQYLYKKAKVEIHLFSQKCQVARSKPNTD